MPQDQKTGTELTLEEFEEKARERYGVPKKAYNDSQKDDRPITLEEFEEQRRKYYGIPTGLAASLRQQESSGNQYDQSGRVLTSPKQAKGRYQVLQATADRYQLNASDPFENVEAAFRYLSDLHKQIDPKVIDPGERWAQTLVGYHAGEGRLREMNKTGRLPSTSDGLIRTDEYVRNIMNRWQQYDQERSGQQPTASAQPQSTARRLGIRPAEGLELNLNEPRSPTSVPQPQRRPSPKATMPVSVALDFRRGGIFEAAREDASRAAEMISPEVNERLAKMEEFERQPWLTRKYQRGYDAIARGGGALSKMARQAVGAGLGVAQGLNSGDFSPIDLLAWRQFEEERNRELEAQRQARPSSFATETVEGIIEAAPQAAAGYALTALTGGGLPAMAAVGGGMSAAGADWEDPKKAATQTVVGAFAPLVGGKVGQRVGGAIASRLSSPAAQTAARVGGELAGGGTGNVLGAGASQLAFDGRLDPRALAESALIGTALSVPGAVATARRQPNIIRVRESQPPLAPRTQPLPPISEPQGPVHPTQPLPSSAIANVPTAEIPAQRGNFQALARAVGSTPDDVGEVRVKDLGLGEIPAKVWEQPSQAQARSQSLPMRATGDLPEISAYEVEDATTAPRISAAQPTKASVSGPRQAEANFDLGAQSSPKDAGESPSLGRAIGSVFRTGSQALRTLKTSLDLSAPFSQGAFLTVSHPILSARAFDKMMRSLSKKQSAAIDNEILNHPLRKLGEDNDLYLATGGPPEEAFMLKALNKVPGIGASERTYRTYLDSLRLSTWESYVKSLQANGHTPENNPRAYKQAAAFINIATGRGSLKPGGAIESAMKLGGDVLFAPRNLVSKFQMLDPVRYATLAPGARKLVLRDAMTSFGTILGTAALLRTAGARVSLDPESDDFLTARAGNTRYDLTFGLKPQMQFLARMMAGAYRQATGEGNLSGKDPLSVAKRYARGKLAPGPGLVYSAWSGNDFKGEKMSDKSAGKLAMEVFAPMTVEDLTEAYQQEGWAGVAKGSPAILGQRVSSYPDRAKADWVDTPKEFREEQKRAGEPRTFLMPRRARGPNEKDETPGQFAARRALASEWTTKYGMQMVSSEIYKSATADEKKAAREYLKRTISSQSGERRPNLELFNPARIIEAVRKSEWRRIERERTAAPLR